MCDLLIDDAYICPDCIAEFKESIGDKALPIREMGKLFREFMRSEKSEYGTNPVVTVDQFLRNRR